MKLITFITAFILTSCGSLDLAKNKQTIQEKIEVIDSEADTIEEKFPKAKPHTDKIKEATPIIREASNEQQAEVIRLRDLVQELQKKETARFKWIVCLGLFGFGGVCAYFGITKLATKFTILGFSMLGGSISVFYYWSYIEKYSIPVLIIYGIVTGTMSLREKDDARIAHK